ncbi:MAG TPA: DUF6174 domain-containing protein [Polyangiaceae bacterium]|nr:DUF6174 domain-containing protein [Polyangiaceae bacterium]
MFRWIGLSVLCAISSGCGSDADVGVKRQQWLKKAPSSYVVGTCTTGFAIGACRLYAVQQGVVKAAEVKTPPDLMWKSSNDSQEPIARLFDSVERGQSGCKVSVDFDETFSYPAKVYFDCGQEGSGEEVRCFQADAVDLEVCRAQTVR